MPFRYLYNIYPESVLEAMAMEMDPIHPPHLLLEVHHACAALYHPNEKWTVRQMGTQRVMGAYHTYDEAVAEAIALAKSWVPNGVVFERFSEALAVPRGTCEICGGA